MARTNQIQVRRGTATQWSNTNPVLASGEPGFDTTNSLLKVGDGTSTWSSLSSNVGVGDAGLLSIAGLTTASGSYLFATSNDVYTTGVITAFGRSLVDDADASTARTTLGLGTLATQSGTFSGTSSGTNTGDQTAASLGLTIGTNVQAYDAGLTSIAGLTTASGSYLYATANDVYTTGTSTVYGRSVLAASGISSVLTTALTAGTGIVLSYNSGTDTATINTSGLVIGTDVQAYDAGLTSIAGLTTASGSYIYATANDVYTTGVITSFGRSLVDDADATTARTTLGLGTLATQSGTFSGTSSGTNTGDQTAASLNLTVGTYTQAYDAGLTSIAGLTTASGSYIYATASDVYTTGTSTVYGRSVLAASGVESLVTTTLTAGTGILLSYNSGTDTVTISTSGLVIGTNVQAYDAGLTSIAGLTTASGNYLYATASDVYTTGVITSFGRSLVDDADATTARTTLGLVIGTDVQAYDAKLQSISTLNMAADNYLYAASSSTFSAGVIYTFGRNFLSNTDSSGAQSTLGLVIGTNVQAYDAGLTSIAGLTTAADRYIYTTANDVYTTGAITTFGRSLVDDADASTSRTTLGLAIGTNVQAYDAGLTSIAGLTTAADRYIYTSANDVYTTGTITTFGRSLVDDADATTARTTLGLGTISTEASGNYALKSSQYIMGILFS